MQQWASYGEKALRVPAFRNSKILRIIGQDLESRDIKAFIISREGNRFDVQGSYQKPPTETPISLEYGFREIDELDLERGQKREELHPSTDFFTIAQTLRAIGGYVDKKGGRLLRLSNNDQNVGETSYTIEYESADGSHVVEARNGSAIYDMCVTMYKLRGKAREPGALFRRGR
jgi:hypothetical protein